jgi:hypothetical protein
LYVVRETVEAYDGADAEQLHADAKEYWAIEDIMLAGLHH